MTLPALTMRGCSFEGGTVMAGRLEDHETGHAPGLDPEYAARPGKATIPGHVKMTAAETIRGAIRCAGWSVHRDDYTMIPRTRRKRWTDL